MKVKFSRCSSNNLAGVPQVDGQLIYTKDTGDVYLDVGNQRHKISNFIIENDTFHIQNPSLDKIYFISGENKLYKYLGIDAQTDEQIWLDLSGASENYVTDVVGDGVYSANQYTDSEVQGAKDYADAQDATILSTANSYTDTALANYSPIEPFDNSFVTNGTTVQLFESIKATHPAIGKIFLGECSLQDAPTGLANEEIRVEVYPNNVYHGTMTSTNVAPYKWEIQYWTGTETWRPVELPDTIVQRANSYTDTQIASTVQTVEGYADTQDTATLVSANGYTDTKIGNINSILDEINGVEV